MTDAVADPSSADIDDCFDLPHCFDLDSLIYKLTPVGGAIWETFARPNWGHFFDGDLTAGGGPGSYTGCDRARVERYVRLVHHLGIVINFETLRWSAVRPWQATYWREVPIGHRVEFEYDEQIDAFNGWDEIPHEVMHLRKWYDWG